ncbi:transglycosylase domain-containing protein [Virgibacillus pantothenticus]|uniref:transglycosylase domain-containing protein n=1 Tax=Virgibacillus pantothenticus TaxID=1473 RepID=UPI0009873019|nr:PBP1A family penicillin-binding protein [Virgibacillus pantothenticus]
MSKQRNRRSFQFILILSGICIAFVIGVYVVSFLLGPPPITMNQQTTLYTSSGEPFSEVGNKQTEKWVELDQVADEAIQATLAVEDRHFYDHRGFDVKRIFGAMVENIKTLSLKEGASTLTQQYARNLYLTHEKTWWRKIKEAFFTVRLEMFYSKSEILEGYLNTIYYGHGAYGIEAASKYFFNKSASELSLAEAAMLAGIPKGPTYYSPFNNQAKAQQRQQQILKIMENQTLITSSAYQTAKNEVLHYRKTDDNKEIQIGSYFQDTAIKEAASILELDADAVRGGGYHIYTTMQKQEQTQLEEQITNTISKQSKIQASGLAINPKTGGIIAMVGGRSYAGSPYNRATQAKRMPGSTFKPFLYYAALERGYNATTMLMSQPTTFKLDQGNVYKPSNFNDYYANKPISLAQALALSDNIYAVKTNMFVGPENLVETARDFGFTSDLAAVPSLALGSEVVSIKEMVRGYSMLANGGKQLDVHTVTKIVDQEGDTIYNRSIGPGEQILDPKKAFILSHLMTGMFDEELNGYMQVTGSTMVDQLDRTYAGKSGSTDSDSWMIGFSPSLVTGVWVGYDDNRTIEVVKEMSYAKDIWANYMTSVHQKQPNESFPIPSGVVGVPVDPVTGLRATPYCPTSRVMFFEKGNEPVSYCNVHLPEDKPNKTPTEKPKKTMIEKLFDLFD